MMPNFSFKDLSLSVSELGQTICFWLVAKFKTFSGKYHCIIIFEDWYAVYNNDSHCFHSDFALMFFFQKDFHIRYLNPIIHFSHWSQSHLFKKNQSDAITSLLKIPVHFLLSSKQMQNSFPWFESSCRSWLSCPPPYLVSCLLNCSHFDLFPFPGIHCRSFRLFALAVPYA